MEWKENHEEWRTGIEDTALRSTEKSGFYNVCTSRASWRAFAIQKFPEFIRRFGLTGIYMDNAQLYAASDCVHQGVDPSAVEYPTLSQRDVFRVIKEELKRNSANPLAIVHSSGGLNAMSFPSADAWVNGEQYRGLVKTDYLDVATMTDFRVELNGKQWGFIPVFLPEFDPDTARLVAPTRKLMAILMQFDAIPWPFWSNVDEVNRGLELLDRFGIDDADFFPYYSDGSALVSDNRDVYIATYRKGTSESLVIASNLSKISQSARLCPRFSSHAGEVIDWEKGHPLKRENGCVQLRIDAGAYTVLAILKRS